MARKILSPRRKFAFEFLLLAIASRCVRDKYYYCFHYAQIAKLVTVAVSGSFTLAKDQAINDRERERDAIFV